MRLSFPIFLLPILYSRLIILNFMRYFVSPLSKNLLKLNHSWTWNEYSWNIFQGKLLLCTLSCTQLYTQRLNCVFKTWFQPCIPYTLCNYHCSHFKSDNSKYLFKTMNWVRSRRQNVCISFMYLYKKWRSIMLYKFTDKIVAHDGFWASDWGCWEGKLESWRDT